LELPHATHSCDCRAVCRCCWSCCSAAGWERPFGGWRHLSSRCPRRAANGRRWQFEAIERQTRSIERSDLPAGRDRQGFGSPSAGWRTPQDHSTPGHTRRRSEGTAQVSIQVSVQAELCSCSLRSMLQSGKVSDRPMAPARRWFVHRIDCLGGLARGRSPR
jgi:hypothetical protein